MLLGLPILCGLLLAWLIATAPKHPVALIRIVDSSGTPLAGSIVRPEGLRTKPGPYVSGWYGWATGNNHVPNPPVTTDKNGYVRVPYPKYVFERIETGTLCLSVDHPEFVPDRLERVVATAPPAGAPWRVLVDDLWDRIRHKTLLAQPEPIVLHQGATLKISVRGENVAPKDMHLFAQVSGVDSEDTRFWIRPEPGVILNRRLAAGPHTARAIRFDSDGSAWFSEVTAITAVVGQTNDLVVTLKRGVTVRGQLDGSVPRPVKNGRVVANVWPRGSKPQDSPPHWHGWAAVGQDGSFAIDSLPQGDLEIVALCQGYVSTNGPGQFQMRYPQKHLLETNDIAITIGMEPTALLEVHVTDDSGNALKDVRVETSPNVRYGEWWSTILMNDCYNSREIIQSDPRQKVSPWQQVLDFQAVSDNAGLAILPNLPVTVKDLAVDHPRYTLPAVGTTGSGKHRQASFVLTPGQTNRLFIQLEPREQSPIKHY